MKVRDRPRKARKPDHEVGYKKLPKATQFKKGQSGNPGGRPKNSKNVNKLVYDSLNEMMEFRENGEPRTATKREVAIKALLTKAHKGDRGAFETLIALDAAYQTRETEQSEAAQKPAGNSLAADKLVLERFLNAHKEKSDDAT